MVQKYILTGGPGSGKSSILLELERKGEYIIREAAEDWIKLQQARGINEPWLKRDFQERILETQIRREEAIPKNIERAFIDRGIPDGLAYVESGTETYLKILGGITRYQQVFLVENLRCVETNTTRRENYEESQRLSEKLEKIYSGFGYDIERIGSGAIEERVGWVLGALKKMKGGEEDEPQR